MSQGLEWLFSYGSNLDWNDVVRWLKASGYEEMRPLQTRIGSLPGYRIVWNYRSVARCGGAANIEHADGCVLPGLLFQVEKRLLHALDEKEGKTYQRWRSGFSVGEPEEEIFAWVYQVKEEHRHDAFIHPTAAYLKTVLNGARKANLPSWHIEELMRTPTQESVLLEDTEC
jgi:hypothetical protein